MVSEPKKMKLDGPDKPDMSRDMYPVLPDELIEDTPLIQVYVDTIKEPKLTSKVVLSLNSFVPVPELTHLKRIKAREVLLFPCEVTSNGAVHSYLEAKGFDVSLLENSVRTVLVAKVPPKTKKQHVKVHSIWPCNFHPDKYLEKLCTNSLFSNEEMVVHGNHMQVAIEVAKEAKNMNLSQSGRGVIVVDPKINSVVAIGYEESCIKHAAMVAIDNVAKTQNGGAWNKTLNPTSESELNLNGIHPELLQHLKKVFPKIQFGARAFKTKSELSVPSDGPYLCTSYYVYSTQEVCVMCAMALVHSRVKRVFYGKSSERGGLGTLCKIHVVKDLNHHYEVFAGLCENQCKELGECGS